MSNTSESEREVLKRKFQELSDSDMRDALKELEFKKLKDEVTEFRNIKLKIDKDVVIVFRNAAESLRYAENEIWNFLKTKQKESSDEDPSLEIKSLRDEVRGFRNEVESLRNENNEIWELLKSNQEKEADAALGSSEVVKTQVKHNKVATLGKEKESCDEVPSSKDNSDEESYLPAEGKERKHDTLRQKFNLLNLDGPNKKQIESKIVLALYEVDAENYGFILADFVYKRLRSLYPILSSMIKHDEWTPSFCRRVAFYIDDYIQYKLPEDDNGITDIHSLAFRIRDESSENVEEDVKKLKDLVNVWLNEFKNLKTKIRLCYIREKACDEINADDSVSAVSGVQIYGSRDDTKYSDEVPWMRYYATEKGLLGKRKEVLLNLHEEFERECAFIIEEYNISVLEPLSLKLSQHLGKKSVWERTDVEMLRKSGEVAISLLLFEDMDCNVKVFSEIDEVVESVEEIREWVEYWVDNFKYVGDSDEELETITKSCD